MRSVLRRTPLLCVALLLCSLGAVAQNTINVPVDQPTIQAGIDAASGGDTVLVAPGTYVENINFRGKGITVKSSAGAKATTIDGNSAGSVVTFKTGETRAAVLDGFTITHGLDISNGGGITVYASS